MKRRNPCASGFQRRGYGGRPEGAGADRPAGKGAGMAPGTGAAAGADGSNGEGDAGAA